MRIYILILIAVLTIFSGNTQDNSSIFIENSLQGKYDNYRSIHPENSLTDLNEYDFSHIWLKTRNKSIFGYIGKNYQRFQVKFISVIKEPSENQVYLVFGKSKVNQNICDFQGEIKIREIHLADNSEYPDKKCGMMIFDYTFFENPKQSHVGIFKGKGVSYWYLDSEGAIKYDDLMDAADGFRNNQFVGIWTEYNKTESKTCNWGDYRIPISGDLDYGTGEFCPGEKYKTYGWENFLDANFYEDDEKREKAKKAELQEWWK